MHLVSQIEEYHHVSDFPWVEKSESAIKHTFYALVLAGAVLDVVVWRYRSLAGFLFYYEQVWTLLLSMTPVAIGAQAAKQTFALIIV